MTQKNQNSPPSNRQNSPYNTIVERMRKLYDGKITEQEAHEAARNLIGFCKLLLEIKAEKNQNLSHEQ